MGVEFNFCYLVTVILVQYVFFAMCLPKTDIEIEQGKLIGNLVKSISKKTIYYAYKGIPYAKPPVGRLKYMPPEPHDSWEGTFEATRHGHYCIQSYEFSDDASGSEDCLFINVYTPKIKNNFKEQDKPFPVMFFVHGGDFIYGSANTTFYGPDYFMDENVILVTMNYRLGTLGFLDMENDVVTGNMGLKDVFLALKWVRKNIAAFGGDEENITIFGQGSGSVMVDILYLSPVAKGLFHKAILQSGSALQSTLFDWKPKDRAYTLTKYLEDEAFEDKSVLEVLNNTSPYKLPGNIMRTVHPDETIFKQIGFQIFSPTLNNKSEPLFLSKLPEDLMEEKNIPNKDVPIMIGFNSQESIYDHRFFVVRPEFIKNLKKRFAFTMPFRGIHAEFDSDMYHSIHYRILWFYFNVTVDITKDSVLNEYLNYYTDLTFLPIDQSVKIYADLNTAPVYYYMFDYVGKLNYFRIKGSHSPFPSHYSLDGASERDELCYLFKCNIMKSVYDKLHASEEVQDDEKEDKNKEDRDDQKEDKDKGEKDDQREDKEAKENKDLKTLRKMVRLWTNFAKTGNPTPPKDDILEGLDWKPVTKEEVNYLNIADEFTLDQNPREKNVEFWNAMYEYYTPLAVDGIVKNGPPEEYEEKESSESAETENQEQTSESKNKTENRDEL